MMKFKALDTTIEGLKGETTHMKGEDEQTYVVVATALNEFGCLRTSIFKSDEKGDTIKGFFHLFQGHECIKRMSHKAVVYLLENGELNVAFKEIR